MRRLSFLISLLLSVGLAFGQSPHTDALSIDCSECHNSANWKVDPSQIKFDHSTTGFSLVGQHLSADCRSCHNSLVFNKALPQCISCHQDIHQNTVGLDCQRCHIPSSWIVANINQLHDESRFPLLGAHLSADCAQCHSSYQNLYFEQLSVDCFGCHQNDYNATTSPNHAAAGFSTDCQDCHSLVSNSWATENFNHDFFPLIGGHNISNCFSCHQPGYYSGLSTECYSCHKVDYEQVQNPNHLVNNYPTDCTMCHSIIGWSSANFDHNSTQFPLIGAHVNVDCGSCHNGNYTNTPNTCYGCHQSDYNNTDDPPHASAGFSTDCVTCHSQSAWSPSTFDHDNQFFPIYSGRHLGAWTSCSDCHINSSAFSVFSCLACHEHNQNDTDNEHREVSGYSYNSEACYTCHPSGSGEGAFNHSLTSFPLTGIHVTLDCNQCHQQGYSGTTTDCYSCHNNAYDNSVNPNHLAAGITTSCESCHNTSAWIPSTFIHSTTGFELLGQHASIQCSSCHEGNTSGLDNLCVSCHQDNYNASTNPSHTSLALPTDCENCHTTNANWQPALFPIHNNYYQLLGAHSSISDNCISCHNNDYNNTPNTCYGCHKSDYDITNDPSHQAAGFPTNCESCHSQNAWKPSTFDHDNKYFPIYSGRHSREWDVCSDCHTSPTNFSVFSCIDCHEHSQSETDSNHRGVQGYVYSSDACYDCHPRGGGG